MNEFNITVTNTGGNWQVDTDNVPDGTTVATTSTGANQAALVISFGAFGNNQFQINFLLVELPPPNNVDEVTNDQVQGMLNTYQTEHVIDAFALIALLIEMNRDQKTAAMEQRLANQEAQYAALMSAAEKTKEAAVAQMIAGIVTGVAQIAGGAFSMGAGFKGLSAVKAAGTDMTAATFQSNLANAQNYAAVGQGAAQVTQGVGGVISAVPQYLAGIFQAEGQELQADATRFQSYAEAESEFVQNLRDAINKLLQFFADRERANAEVQNMLARG